MNPIPTPRSPIPFYCDMDGVLVHQTAPSGFDRMPWMPDGRQLWEFIKGYRPTLLTSVADERFGDTCREKLAWIDRELGRDVPVIFAPKSRGKAPYCVVPGAILIDDSEKHCGEWRQAGGRTIRHRSAADTIAQAGLLIGDWGLGFTPHASRLSPHLDAP